MIALVFYLILILHILACIWFAVIQIDKKWFPTYDFMHAGYYDVIYNYYWEQTSQ